MGIAEQTVFPEVDSANITFHQGMNINDRHPAENNTEGHALLAIYMPFRVEETPCGKESWIT